MDPLVPNAGVEAIVCSHRPRQLGGRDARSSKRAGRAARRALIEIERLRVPCCCCGCRLRKKWPGHYMGYAAAVADRALAGMGRQKAEGRRQIGPLLISFECNLEREEIEIDADMAEELRLLRNEPVRYGAIWVGTQARARRD